GRDHADAHPPGPRTDQVEPFRRGLREIEHAPLYERPAVVDADAHALARVHAQDVHDGPERKLPVRRGEERGVVDLARSGRFAIETVSSSVPGGDAVLEPAGRGLDRRETPLGDPPGEDRKITRLNSSHQI